MNKKFLLLFVFGIFLLSLMSVSATTWGTVKQGEEMNLIMVCPITGCNQTNITSIIYPNSTTAISNVEATHVGNQWNYTFAYTEGLGIYQVYGFSTNGTSGAEEYFIGDFEVTGTGINQSVSQGIGSAIYLLLMMGLMIVFGIAGFKLVKTENLWILGVFSIFLSVILLIYNTWLGYQYHRALTGLPDSSMPEILFYTFLLLLVLGFLASLALLFLNWKKVIKYIKKEIRDRKDENNKEVEDWDFDGDWK